jgi:pimeloyl-ACP methyl ester carboxylesterase
MKRRVNIFSLIFILVLCTGVLFNVQPNCALAGALPVGESSYLLEEDTGATADPIRIFTYRSAGWRPGNIIVFVFHGMNRNAEDYRSGWMAHADENNLLIICPEFTKAKYPGTRYYHTGNIMDRTDGSGRLQPKIKWVFPAADRIISNVKSRMEAYESPVVVFGHSAGGQFVHRYAFFGEDSDVCLIMPSNGGVYTMPDNTIPYPYGLGGVPLRVDELAAAFAKPVVLLLGEADVKRSSNLRMTPEADRQGMNRLERGRNFFEVAKRKAAELGVPFNWKLVIVPGVGHNGTKMGNAAMRVIKEYY